MAQTWEHLLFAHWAVPPATLAPTRTSPNRSVSRARARQTCSTTRDDWTSSCGDRGRCRLPDPVETHFVRPERLGERGALEGRRGAAAEQRHVARRLGEREAHG